MPAKVNYQLSLLGGFTNLAAAAVLMWMLLRPVLAGQTSGRELKQNHSAYFTYPHLSLLRLCSPLFFPALHQSSGFLPQRTSFFPRTIYRVANGILIALLEMVLIYSLEGASSTRYIVSAAVVGATPLLFRVFRRHSHVHYDRRHDG